MVAWVDTHYERNGKKKIHLAIEPLTRWVTVEVTDQRRACEWVDRMVELAEDYYPVADHIRVVMDYLNTHNPANFYQFLLPDEAQEYIDSFDSISTRNTGVG